MASELDQASGQLERVDLENERSPGRGSEMKMEIAQMCLNLKQIKSFEILKSAVNIFTSNTKLMLFMILSIIPLFSFMLFFEIKLHNVIFAAPKLLDYRPYRTYVYSASTNKGHSIGHYGYFFDDYKLDYLSEFLQLCVFGLVLYPLLETFSMIITMRVTEKVHAGEKQSTLKEVLCQKNDLKGLSVTCLCVCLLSNLTLLGLVWILVNSRFFTSDFNLSYDFNPVEFCFKVLHIAIYSTLFVALFYKYLDWSAFWNMGMVISVLGEETGIGAFGMADYYGKHCRKTGFQLMLVLFAFGNLLRLPCLIAGLWNASVGGVLVAAFSIGLFCLGNLVKWVVFVLYFYDCKHHTLEKKSDEKVGKVGNASDAC